MSDAKHRIKHNHAAEQCYGVVAGTVSIGFNAWPPESLKLQNLRILKGARRGCTAICLMTVVQIRELSFVIVQKKSPRLGHKEPRLLECRKFWENNGKRKREISNVQYCFQFQWHESHLRCVDRGVRDLNLLKLHELTPLRLWRRPEAHGSHGKLRHVTGKQRGHSLL